MGNIDIKNDKNIFYFDLNETKGYNFEKHHTSNHQTDRINTYSNAKWFFGTKCVGQKIA